MKILATFISGINCIKGVELKKQTATLSQEVAAVDFGLDLAANESRNPAQPADLQRSASQPTRKDCPAGRVWSARMAVI